MAERQGNFAGFICVYLDKDSKLGTLIDNLHIEPKYRQYGVATALMANAANWMQNQRPKTSVYLEVYAENKRAQKFYTNLAGTFTTKNPFEVKAVDGGKTLAFHVAWNFPSILIQATNKKTELFMQKKSRAGNARE